MAFSKNFVNLQHLILLKLLNSYKINHITQSMKKRLWPQDAMGVACLYSSALPSSAGKHLEVNMISWIADG